jgi:hypothetical protein
MEFYLITRLLLGLSPCFTAWGSHINICLNITLSKYINPTITGFLELLPRPVF